MPGQIKDHVFSDLGAVFGHVVPHQGQRVVDGRERARQRELCQSEYVGPLTVDSDVPDNRCGALGVEWRSLCDKVWCPGVGIDCCHTQAVFTRRSARRDVHVIAHRRVPVRSPAPRRRRANETRKVDDLVPVRPALALVVYQADQGPRVRAGSGGPVEVEFQVAAARCGTGEYVVSDQPFAGRVGHCSGVCDALNDLPVKPRHPWRPVEPVDKPDTHDQQCHADTSHQKPTGWLPADELGATPAWGSLDHEHCGDD